MHIDLAAMEAALKEKDETESKNKLARVGQMTQAALRRAFPVSLVVLSLLLYTVNYISVFKKIVG